MIKNAHRTSVSSLLRRIFCSLFVVAAVVALVAAVASSQGGSTSPEGDGKKIAVGANLGGKAAVFSQRVEDNAFHPVSQRVGGNPVNVANKIAPWVVEHTAYGQQS